MQVICVIDDEMTPRLKSTSEGEPSQFDYHYGKGVAIVWRSGISRSSGNPNVIGEHCRRDKLYNLGLTILGSISSML